MPGVHSRFRDSWSHDSVRPGRTNKQCRRAGDRRHGSSSVLWNSKQPGKRQLWGARYDTQHVDQRRGRHSRVLRQPFRVGASAREFPVPRRVPGKLHQGESADEHRSPGIKSRTRQLPLLPEPDFAPADRGRQRAGDLYVQPEPRPDSG